MQHHSRRKEKSHGVPMLPYIVAHIHDSYIFGVCRLRAAMLGLFTVAEVRGEGEIARGELMRYFTEMAWYPTALLPSQSMRWEAVDNRSANATLVDGTTSLTLLFRFDEVGLITSVHAQACGAAVGRGALETISGGHSITHQNWQCCVCQYMPCCSAQKKFTKGAMSVTPHDQHVSIHVFCEG